MGTSLTCIESELNKIDFKGNYLDYLLLQRTSKVQALEPALHYSFL
jgi:hypothetical protein